MIGMMKNALRKPMSERKKKCTWKSNENEGYWETTCGNIFWFTDDGPEDGFANCPYCGEALMLPMTAEKAKVQ